jgi:Putative beta-barrel porin-2, OmpL-like. bbp2
MKKLIITALLGIGGAVSYAQNDSINPLKISGLVEGYYGFDFRQPSDGNRPAFLYNHNRHNEVNLNLGLLRASYTQESYRVNLGLMIGTYAQQNLAAEPELLRNVFEASVGVRVGTNTWVDAGVFASHIGFESAISKDCWTLSRGLLAENSPYYESGIKLTHTPNEQWTLTLLYLNGWQRIRRVAGNSTPAFGTQIVYKPTNKWTLNWSTFVGNDKPDAQRQMRYFNNWYGIWQATDRFGLTLGFDLGYEQKEKGSSSFNTWYSPVVIARYQLNNKWASAFRLEQYSDQNGVIIAPDFKTNGASLNFDYALNTNVLWRIEGRYLERNSALATDQRDNFSVLTSLSVSF